MLVKDIGNLASSIFSAPSFAFFDDKEGGGGGGAGGDPPGGAGGDGAPGGDAAGGKPEGGKPEGGKSDGDSIPPSKLQGILDAQKRATQAELKSLRDSQQQLTETITALRERLETLGDASDKKGVKKPDEKEDPEKVELRRRLSELEKAAQASASRAEQEAAQRREYEFKTTVSAALAKAGCFNPEAAFLVIKPLLTHSEDNRIFATVKSEFGEEDLDLDTFIDRNFAEEVLPQLFKGRMRGGSPAGGDSGSGSGFMFTKEQLLNDPELYAKDPEKARMAIERGLVKGVPRPGSQR